MTPEEARNLLECTTPGPWEADDEGPLIGGIWSPNRIIFGSYFDREDIPQWEQGELEDRRLMAAAPDMAAMIAGMRAEYAVRLPDGQLNDIGWGDYDAALEDKNTWRRYGFDAYIVVRYVTAPQPLGEKQ